MIDSIWFRYTIILIYLLLLFARIVLRTLASMLANVMSAEFPLLDCLSKHLVSELC